MSTTVSVLIQFIEHTDGDTVYAADKQCNYVQYTLQRTTTYKRYGASHGKDKKLRDEVLKAVLLKKQVI